MMPGKDGYKVCTALKKEFRTSHIPIVLLTARADMDSRIRGLEHDADGDQLIHVGEYYSFQDFSNKSYLHYDGNTGKFEGAEGWLITTGQIDPVTGINILTAAGAEPLDK